jgi:sterol desaturase/sphingolipid hydroxylase (fatty acid hydroxylase superfamily)
MSCRTLIKDAPPSPVDRADTEEKKKPEPWRVDLSSVWDFLVITIAVTGTALIIFAAARNTITWHLERFWGASGDFWQSNWEKIYDWFEGDAFNMGVWGTFCTSFASFWVTNIFLTYLDWRGRPETLLKYKVQQGKNQPVATKKLLNAIMVVMFNMIFIGIPSLFFGYYVWQWRGCGFGRELPTFNRVLLDFVIIALAEEIGFYYSHRLFHWPPLYKRVHKKHHEWTAPIGIVALYAHPLEHFLSNMIPVGLGPFLAGSHIATMWLWYSVATVVTIISHCGYHFPLLPSSEFHDFHHLKFNYNYGVFGFLDRLHGTDSLFRKMTQWQRHRVLLRLTPLSQTYPDESKNKKEAACKDE